MTVPGHQEYQTQLDEKVSRLTQLLSPFSAGAEALEADTKLRLEIGERVKAQLRFVQMGATTQSFK